MPATTAPTALPIPTEQPSRIAIPWRRLVPLWRHAVWVVALFGVLVVATAVRLDVQRLHMDLDRNDRLQNEASVLNQRLQLELDARRRLAAMQGVATSMALDANVGLVRVAR